MPPRVLTAADHEIVRSHDGLIGYVMRELGSQWELQATDWDDVEGAIRLTLCKCVTRHDPSLSKFSSYAVVSMLRAGHATCAASRRRCQPRRVIRVRTVLFRDLPPVFDRGEAYVFARDDLTAEVNDNTAYAGRVVPAVLNTLLTRERGVIEMRYGLNGATRPHTLDEIGRRLGVTRERIRQIEIAAMRKLRKQLEKP